MKPHAESITALIAELRATADAIERAQREGRTFVECEATTKMDRDHGPMRYVDARTPIGREVTEERREVSVRVAWRH